MKAKLKTLTPIHIGSGDSISPLEYYVDSETGRFCVLNINSLLSDSGFSPYVDKFIREAGLVRNISKIINDESILRKHVIYAIPISSEARQSNFIEVKAFSKSANRPYIPGSSLKGSIISALMYFALKELYQDNSTRSEIVSALTISGKRVDKELNKIYEQLTNLAYDYLAEGYNNGQRQGKFTNLFDVSDSNCLMPEESMIMEVCRVEGARKGGQIPIFYETLREGIEVNIEISRRRCRFSEKKILEICHDFYEKIARKDGFNVPTEPYLIRIGQGATAFSTSFLILAEELGIRNYRLNPPRTRKRLVDGMLKKSLGFIQIKLL